MKNKFGIVEFNTYICVVIKKENIMTKAKFIVEKARKDLVDFIAYEAKLLFKKFGWVEPEEGEDYSITTGDLKKDIFITVEVDNSYLDVEDACTEKRGIEEIVVSEQGEVWFIEEEGKDWTPDEISIEELAAIADTLEETYNK